MMGTYYKESEVKRYAVMNLALVCAAALAFAGGCDKEKKDGEKDEVSADKGTSNKGADSAKPSDEKAGNASAKTGGDKAAEAPPKAAVKKADTWKAFTDDTHGFSVEGPIAPEKGEQDVPTAIGTLKAYTYGFTPPGAQGAMLAMVTPSYFAEGDLDVQRMLDDGQAGALGSMGGTLAESKDIEMDGAPGRMFRFTATPQGMKASGYVKVFLRDGALYQVMMVHADAATAFKAQGERFVDSFKFTAKKS